MACAPASYALNYVSGKKNKSTRIGFSGGSVVSTQNVPPVRPKGEWIEVQAAQLKAVSDPLTGMVVRADEPWRGVQAARCGCLTGRRGRIL